MGINIINLKRILGLLLLFSIITAAPVRVARDVHSVASGTNNARAVVADQSGRLFVVYSGRGLSNYQIYIAYSIDGGATWDPTWATITTSALDDISPSIAIDSNDTLHIVWCGNISSSNDADLLYTKYPNPSITTLCSRTGYPGAHCPSIAVDSNDDLHVAWTGCPSAWFVRYKHYNSITGVWGPNEDVGTRTPSRWPSIEVDSADRPHIVYRNEYNSHYHCAHRYKESGAWVGFNGEDHDTLDILPASVEFSSVFIDPAGNLHAVWEWMTAFASNPDSVRYRKYDILSTSWLPIYTPFGNGPADTHTSYNGDVIVDDMNNVYIFYHDNDSLYCNVSRDGGATFTLDTLLSNDARARYPNARGSNFPAFNRPVFPCVDYVWTWNDPDSAVVSLMFDRLCLESEEEPETTFVAAEIVEPLPGTWTSCADQQIIMDVSVEGSMFAQLDIPSNSTTTEYFDTLTDSWVPAVNISYSGWWTPLFPGSSWIWDSHYSGGITGRCLTFRIIIESPPGAVIDSAGVQMFVDNTATFYMNGDSIGADDDGSTWHHKFEFDMLPFMHGGADTLTIEACDLTGVVVGVNFLATVIYRADCKIDESSIEMSIDGVTHLVGDGFLDLIDSTQLVFSPIPPDTFEDGDTVHVCLDSLESTCDGYLETPICWDFYVDLVPPVVFNRQPMPDSLIDDPTPTISANIVDHGSGLDTSTVIFTVDHDTISGADYSLVWADSMWSIEYIPTSPIMAAESVCVCIYGTDTTDYCPDNEMADCWAFVNMREREVWFPTIYGARCDTVIIPLIIDGLDYSWIASADMQFSVDPDILTPIDIVTDGSISDGWTVGDVVVDSVEGTIVAHINGSSLSGGPEGNFLFMLAIVNCNAFGGQYCPIVVDTMWLNEGMPKVTYKPGLFIVELEPRFFSCDIYLNRTAGTPTEDHVVTFGASASGTEVFDAGLDIGYIPPPAWRVDGWFDLDDPDEPLITKLTRDIRAIAPTKTWLLITDDEPWGIARWNGSSLPEGEFRMNGVVDMKRDSVCEFYRNDTLVIEWTVPELFPRDVSFVSGWNLVSSPVLPTDIPPNEVFQTDLGVYRYITPEYRYAFAERIRDGEGYWVWTDSSYSVPVVGGQIETYLRAIYPGWNMIGAPAVAVSIGEIATDPAGAITGDIYYYSGGIYWAADSLVPGVGYWLLSTRDAVLEVPSTHSRRIASRPEIEWSAILSNENLRLEMAFAPSKTEDISAGDIAIPPTAPGMDRPAVSIVSQGIDFGRKLSSSSWEIEAREPVHLDLDCPEFITIKIGDNEFHSGGIVALDPGIHKVLAEIALPTEPAILRSEPNPFNASTNIVVAIPEKSTVDIAIFDIVGKRIFSRNIEINAGIHKIRWDGISSTGENMPAGIYFVRMQVGEKTSCMKTILIK